jgi:hypothetical protein
MTVHSLSAAQGWYFDDLNAISVDALQPVVCFVLATTFDPAHPNASPNQCVIPLSSDQIGMELGCVSFDLPTIVHESELRSRFGE